ncbi:MAG: formate--tetrahydrofolate ligase [Bacteroidetes bacterium]|nr:formate--tetrahydrofolate ligase [Bacteroidota bacterium]
MTTVKTGAEIAREITPELISKIATQLGFTESDLIPFGHHIAKIEMSSVQSRIKNPIKTGKLILVSAITPTPAGEGKTTISVGLTQAFHELNLSVAAALREPSLGPCLGVKGGATGGGYAQVLPMEAINLHFTGDIHAVTTAHNLISASIDHHLFYGNEFKLDPNQITWNRVMDMNDRSLRDIVVGLGGSKNGIPRQTGFDITAASEIMAILCLASDYKDLKLRISKIVIGYSYEGKPVTVKDLKVTGTVAALLRDALQPNLVQAIGGAPVFIHGGPFANIAQGANSLLATRLALSSADYVVTEAGFGFDLGGEKFFDIVSRYGGFYPASVVLVATVRALKMHGGVTKDNLSLPNAEAVLRGRENLEKHIENVRHFGIEPVVAINRFHSDSEEEISAILSICNSQDVTGVPVNFWAEGGKGGLDLARILVSKTAGNHRKEIRLYESEVKVEEKIERISRMIYGAGQVDFQPKAKTALKSIYTNGFGNLPVCLSKTQNSLSDNPKLLGRPRDFTLSIRDILVSAGAGFLVVLTGELMRMPGLPAKPASQLIDLEDDGTITGLF